MSQKRPETDDTVGEISLKRLRISLIDDDGDDDEEESMEESTNVVEIMKSLEVELNYPRNNHQMMKSRSSSSSSSSSLSSSLLSIINGCDGESCGPSFSDSSSTVMASLDMSSTCFSYLVGPTPTPTIDLEDSSSYSSSSSSSPPGFGFTGEEGNDEINGCDEDEEVEEEDEDEWLERVLNETPIEEEFLWKEERSDLSF